MKQDFNFSSFIKTMSIKDNFFKFMRFQVVKLEPGHTYMKVFIDKDFHTNRRQTAHGSVLAALSDSSMGWACRTLGYDIVTMNIDISFVRPTLEGEWIYAEGVVLHKGSKTMVCETILKNEQEKKILIGKGTYFIRNKVNLIEEF